MFGWDYWRGRAKQGDLHALSMMHALLAEDVDRQTTSVAQREYLANLFSSLAAAKTSTQRRTIAVRGLLFERGPGRPPHREETRRAWAYAVFDRVGEVSGGRLERACGEVAIEFGLGRRGNKAPDLRAIKKAYREYLPLLLELRQLGYDRPYDSSDRLSE